MDNYPINSLIDDCLEEIFSYLSLSDLVIAETVCSRWKSICQHLRGSITKLHCESTKFIFTGTYKKYVVESIDNIKSILQHLGSSISHFHLLKSLRELEEIPPIFKVVAECCENIQIIFITVECVDTNISEHKLDTKELSKLISRNKKLIFFSLEADFNTSDIDTEFLSLLPSTLVGFRLIKCPMLSPHSVCQALKNMKCLHALTFLDTASLYEHAKETILNYNINIRRLNLGLCDIMDVDIINIVEHFKQLDVLDVSGCKNLTNRGLSSIGELKHLKQLRVANLETVTDQVVDSFPDALTALRCTMCESIKDDGIIRLIKRSSNLTLLDIRNCSGITNRTIIAAIELSKNHSTKVTLNIYYSGSRIDLSEIEKIYHLNVNAISPFLKVFEQSSG